MLFRESFTIEPNREPIWISEIMRFFFFSDLDRNALYAVFACTFNNYIVRTPLRTSPPIGTIKVFWGFLLRMVTGSDYGVILMLLCQYYN